MRCDSFCAAGGGMGIIVAMRIEDTHPTLAAARRLDATVRAHAAETTSARCLAAPLVDAFVEAGFYRMLIPKAVGGEEVPPQVFVSVLEALGKADGSAAWCVMVGATTGLVAALLPEDAAREVFPKDVVPSGVFAPIGTASVEPGGLRVSGRWPFASGSERATVRLAGVVVKEEGQAPRVSHVLVAPKDMHVVDTWRTAGLRGTGSHDMVAESVFVPDARTLSLFGAKPRHGGPLYAFPFFGLLSLGIAAVAMGVASAALDAFAELAAKKTPGGSKRALNQRETVHLRFAEATAALGAARAFVAVAVADAEAEARAEGAVSVPKRATLRLAAANAVRASAAAVDLVYGAAGGSSIYADHPLQRQFQDVHVATQHMMVAEPVWTLAGRVMLGVESDTSQL